MKLIFSLLITTLSISAFAGSLTKVDLGTVSWSILQKNSKGNVTVVRRSLNVETKNLNPREMDRVSLIIPIFLSKTVIDNVTFELNDERSQEEIEGLITKTLYKDIDRLAIRDIQSNVVLTDVTCEEKGFLKKELQCSANFKSEELITLK